MDPLSVASSIAGLVSAAGMVNKALGPYIAAVRDTPKIAFQVYSETQSATIILSALQNLTTNLSTINRQRAALIQLDQIVAVLTDGVLIFSDLEACVEDLPPAEPSITPLALRYRLGWARKESALSTLLGRLEAFKSSMSLMLNILQSHSSIQAEQCQQELRSNVTLLLETSKNLARLLTNLEDVFDARSIITRSRRHSYAPSIDSVPTTTEALVDRQESPFSNSVNSYDSSSAIFSPTNSAFSEQSTLPSSASTRATTPTHSARPLSSHSALLTSSLSRPFECHLELSRVYRQARNPRNSMDFSFRSSIARTNAWSVFSDLSLGEISVLSVIALPIYPDDLRNSHHYDFGDPVESGNRELLPGLLPCSHSLWRSCVELELLLTQIPEIEERILKARGRYPSGGVPLFHHPFFVLQYLFADGYPFLLLVNILAQHKGHTTLTQDLIDYDATNSARYPLLEKGVDIASGILGLQDMFTLSDITGESRIIGFLKVFRVFQALLRLLLEDGYVVAVDEEVDRQMEPMESNLKSETIKVVVEDFIQAEISYINDLASLECLGAYITTSKYFTSKESQGIFGPVRQLIELHLDFLLKIEGNLPVVKEPQIQNWAAPFEMWSKKAKLYGSIISTERRNKALLRRRMATPIKKEMRRCLELLSVPSRRPEEYLRFVKDLQVHSNNGASRGLDISKAVPIVNLAMTAIEGLTERRNDAKSLRQPRLGWMIRLREPTADSPVDDAE
ncbi:hypothetical protein QBC42DRAFT_275473 [Cladorrhinum samala]|uniref:DH domain-containing protein n=1 Tax=Cladorrhinum samala TaxID=585594 RepID=A0AAV9HGD0_9PEZI|nr:hypothetical protein QBC42DRAFT_275473 [Cladorrhinum samala]